VEEGQEVEENQYHPTRQDLERQLLNVEERVKEYWYMGDPNLRLLGRQVDC